MFQCANSTKSISHFPRLPSSVNDLLPTSSSQHCILSTVRPVWVKHLWPIHLPTFLLTFNQALLTIQEHTLRCNCITYGLVWTKDILSRHWYDLAISLDCVKIDKEGAAVVIKYQDYITQCQTNVTKRFHIGSVWYAWKNLVISFLVLPLLCACWLESPLHSTGSEAC